MSAQTKLEPFTVVVTASELPKSIIDRFPEPPAAEARFSLTVERAETEAERLASLQQDIKAGLDDLAAGRASEAEAVFARLRTRFGTG
jgi:hypothetical protein